ncbi:MAG TPA: LuxR C-terminal-related transcriptional regulator [Kineosporiaceae bacterium]|nr:LuxR C-terminal-related transcriptional regulator [Kineosporiaceae bacterium]
MSTAGLPGGEQFHAVHRTAAIRLLKDLDERVHLVLLVAPVGYGKTTLVREFVNAGGSAVTWLTMTPRLGSRAGLLEELVRRWPRRAQDALSAAVNAVSEDAPAESVAQLLISSVAEGDLPAVIVMDDLHLLRSRAGLDLVVALARRLPAGSRIIAMASHRPQLPLGRLHSEHACLEIGPGELAFSDDEAGELIRQAGLDLDEQAVHELVQRTEGWPVGLQLAVRALRRRPDPVRSIAEIDGSHDAIADYFRTEVLAHLSVATVRFLMSTAVLDRMCASLCDAALGTTGSAVWLDEICALGLFVVPGDEHGEWFRYHRLFRDTLRAELRRREPGEDLHVLRGAAQWYEDHGAYQEAIAHAMAGQARFLAAQLITTHGTETVRRADLRALACWLEVVGEDMFEEYPPLAVVASWIRAATGDAASARQALSAAERLSFDGPVPNGSTSYTTAVATVRAVLAPDGVDGMLADAQRAARLEPPGGRWHPVTAVMLGIAHWFTGSPDEAARDFERATPFGRDDRRPGVAFALGERALLAARQGDWGQACACAEQARPLLAVRGLSEHIGSLPAFTALAQVALHQGDTRRGSHNVRQALQLYEDPSPVALPWMAVQVAATLGEVLVGLGDIARARKMLLESRRHLAQLPTTGILGSVVDDLAVLLKGDARQGDMEVALDLTPAERKVLELLPTHYTLNEIADELGVSRNTIKTHVGAIYRKLDAVNRTEAVHRAQHLGLVLS